MKIRFLLLLLISALCTPVSVFAENDPESNLVEVLMADSSRIQGYLRFNLKTGMKRLFSPTGSINKYINVGEERKGGPTKEYKAEDVIEYRFLEQSEDFPEGTVYVSENINAPAMFKPSHYVRGFALELNRSDAGSILKWSVFEQSGGRNSVARLVPAVGVKLKGANAAYGILVNGRVFTAYLYRYLKKAAPEFNKMLEEYFDKGPDRKAHIQELKDNPSIILTLYEEYLKDHDPIDDRNEK